MARDKEDTAEYDARLDREGKKLDNNNFVARWNPYLKDQANAANVNLQNELTTLRKQRQESVGAGRGEVNPPNAYKKGGKVKATNKSSASKRADGIITKGHTKGRYL